MQRGILALDLSRHTGWAFGRPGDAAPLCGVWELPGISDLGACYGAFQNVLLDAITIHQPSLVIMEAPLQKQQTSARLLLGLASHVESCCYHREVECREQHSSTVRKAVIGRGTFPTGEAKDHIMAWCRQQGWNPPTHDAGDALVLWAFACQQRLRRAA